MLRLSLARQPRWFRPLLLKHRRLQSMTGYDHWSRAWEYPWAVIEAGLGPAAGAGGPGRADVPPERLRSLRQENRLPRKRLSDNRVAGRCRCALHRISRRESRQRGAILRRCRDDPRDQLGTDERPCTVVDDHDLTSLVHNAECVQHGILTPGAARYHPQRLRGLSQIRRRTAGHLRGERDDELIYRRVLEIDGNAAFENGPAANRKKLLRDGAANALAAAAGRNDG